MRINIETDEHIVASLPKVWNNQVGFMGFFKKSKEGVLVLTNRKLIFVPKWIPVTPKERDKFFGEDEAKVALMDNYSESDLDEDISEQSSSILLPLESIVNVENAKLRKVNFMRVKCMIDGRTKMYDFGIAKSVTNYPIRQPLIFYNLDWGAWISLIKSHK
ncbi:MAG: hypothetical protein HMLIMOIP_001659 [Candidatus Nitrosomirales archaeon]